MAVGSKKALNSMTHQDLGRKSRRPGLADSGSSSKYLDAFPKECLPPCPLWTAESVPIERFPKVSSSSTWIPDPRGSQQPSF